MWMSADSVLSEFEGEGDPVRAKKKVLGQIADLLDRNGIDVEDIGRIHKVNVWQGFYKDEDGEAHTVDMAGIQLSPTWETGPEWPVVQPAAPCKVVHKRKAVADRSTRRTAILPDPQIGYRILDDGTMIPMHDEQAIECTLELLSAIRPDAIVWLGDTMDLPEWSSKFIVLPEFVRTTQPTVDRTHRFLVESIAAAGPQCEEDLRLLEGNHDNRMANWIARNAMAALRLKRANAPDSWPVLSVPHLLHLDELGITYVDGYPAGKTKIADRHGRQAALYAIHGEKLDVAKQAKKERFSTVQGHAHHVALHTETYDDEDPLEVEAWSLGCLCRLDGAVPSTKGGTDSKGRYIPRTESWQHAIGVLTETEDEWSLDPIRIRNGRALWEGKVYTA